MSTERAAGHDHRRRRLSLAVGWIGIAAVAAGYLLEAIRQRGDCDAGDRSPDTLGFEVVLILLVGGLLQVVAIAATAVAAVRRRATVKEVALEVMPSLLSLAGSLAIFAVAGRGPSTWFQYCAT